MVTSGVSNTLLYSHHDNPTQNYSFTFLDWNSVPRDGYVISPWKPLFRFLYLTTLTISLPSDWLVTHCTERSVFRHIIASVRCLHFQRLCDHPLSVWTAFDLLTRLSVDTWGLLPLDCCEHGRADVCPGLCFWFICTDLGGGWDIDLLCQGGES